jgi:hypothetical protein
MEHDPLLVYSSDEEDVAPMADQVLNTTSHVNSTGNNRLGRRSSKQCVIQGGQIRSFKEFEAQVAITNEIV